MLTLKRLLEEGMRIGTIAACPQCIIDGAEGWWVPVEEVGTYCHQNHFPDEPVYRRTTALICPTSCPIHEGDEFAYLTQQGASDHIEGREHERFTDG